MSKIIEYCHPMSPINSVFANQERFCSPILTSNRKSLSEEILLVFAGVFSCLEMFAIVQTVSQ